jgi:hypothetical protein
MKCTNVLVSYRHLEEEKRLACYGFQLLRVYLFLFTQQREMYVQFCAEPQLTRILAHILNRNLFFSTSRHYATRRKVVGSISEEENDYYQST